MSNLLHDAAWRVFIDPRISTAGGVPLEATDPIVADAAAFIEKQSGTKLSDKALSFICWYFRKMGLMNHRHRDKIHHLTPKGASLLRLRGQNQNDAYRQFYEMIKKLAKEATAASKAKRVAQLNVPPPVVAQIDSPPSKTVKERNGITVIVDGKTYFPSDNEQNRDILRRMVVTF